MKYVVQDNYGNDWAFEANDVSGVTFTDWQGNEFSFTEPEFKDFRKAVGYVWQEVHSDGE